MLFRIFTLFYFTGIFIQLNAQSPLWQDVDVNQQTRSYENSRPAFIPNNSRAVTLNTAAMEAVLWEATSKNDRNAQAAIIDIPLQYGGFESYEVFQNPNIFAENMRPKYGNTIRAFSGHKVGDETTEIHLTLGYGMFNAVVYRPDNNLDYIEYASDLKNNTFFVYRRGDEHLKKVSCHAQPYLHPNASAQRSNGPTEQEVYNLCMTTSGSFTEQFGDSNPTDAEMQAVIIGQINNTLNPIFNRDIGIIFSNATIDEAIFLVDGTNTPFSDESDSDVVSDENGVFLNEGQPSAFANIVNADYDIGHAQVYAGSGGIAIAGVCDEDTFGATQGLVNGEDGINKAVGMSGVFDPMITSFTIEYIAHEIGHQFGCNHSYATVESMNSGCDTGEAGARYETGSGTTIMSYLSVCSSSNVYPKSDVDPFFHAHNIDEAENFISNIGCASVTSATNAADPVVMPEAPTMSIPKGTPFVLVGTVTDSEGLPTAAWNQFDLAANDYDGGNLSTLSPTTDGPPLSTNTSGPLVVFEAPAAPDANNKITRIIPKSAPFDGTDDWEVLPTVARTMNFRLMGRDNQTGANSFGRTASATTVVTVTNDGPMAVTQPSNNQNTEQGESINVVFTGLPSGICGAVDVFLSTDGGVNYSPTALATNVNNTGSVTVTIPANAAETSNAAILVQCATASGELFGNCTTFQISPAFNIAAALPVELGDVFAKKAGTANEINWTTLSEINNEGFEVQRSDNGRDWIKIGFVEGAGNSNTTQDYRWLDENPLSPISYYRLKQMDFDGKFSFSKIVEVSRGKPTTQVAIFPNPNKGSFHLNFSNELSEESLEMEVYDLTGRVVHRQVLTQQKEFIQTDNLPQGIYFVRINHPDHILDKKVMLH